MNLDALRRCFPALSRTHDGLPVAYFDGPGGTQVPRSVADAMTDYLFHHNANTHWAYPTSEETDAIIAAARQAAGQFLHATADEISFGANMTTITFHLARAVARTWKAGDEVIVTELDHHANVAPWRALEIDRGIVVRTARMIPETCQIDMDHLARLTGPKTRLIAIGGASNAVGTINDLARVRQIARSAGALFFVDAVHLAPHARIDVRALDCDFLAVSAYKFYGPHIGILYARKALQESLPFPKLEPAPDTGPERVETGTQNQEGMAGVKATVEFMNSIDHHWLHQRGEKLTKMLWDGLQTIKGVRLFGPPPDAPRTPTVAFTVDGMTSEQVARALVKRAIFASHGDFYAATVIRVLGVEGLVRIGCAAYTTEEEVQRLLDAVTSASKA
ncbi:MAG TPA: cysteine desulfurase-like protein [Thermoanaerobaculia bacterium]|nr:cysteine desulfurase-like protein [Thermoanaerobaculia bacterium]